MNLDTATIDRLRELGATDEVLKWLEHPEAVARLLGFAPMYGYDGVCPACAESTEFTTHRRDCEIMVAWRQLGDPRADGDVERAHSEALVENSRRDHALPRGIQTALQRMERVTDLLRQGRLTEDQARRLLEAANLT